MKRINKILLIMLSFLLITYTNAEELEEKNVEEVTDSSEMITTTGNSERTEANNYGVNKNWTINSSNMSNVLKTPLVDSSLKIYDYANILSDEDETKLKKQIDDFVNSTNMDMVILTINEPYVYEEDIETIASDFYDYNDFGIGTKYYDGILLVRNTYEEDPFFNIYTFGEGQLYFEYDRCESILDEIYPYFKDGKDYYNGMKIFIEESNRYYKKGYDETKFYLNDYGELVYYPEPYKVPYIWTILSGGITSVLGVLGLSKKNKMVMKSTEANDYIDKSNIKYTLSEDKFISTITTHHVMSDNSSGGGSGGGFSHSGSSGGFHGGGGGRHG